MATVFHSKHSLRFAKAPFWRFEQADLSKVSWPTLTLINDSDEILCMDMHQSHHRAWPFVILLQPQLCKGFLFYILSLWLRAMPRTAFHNIYLSPLWHPTSLSKVYLFQPGSDLTLALWTLPDRRLQTASTTKDLSFTLPLDAASFPILASFVKS